MVGFRITSLGTLISRVLGMVRDMATAALLGMSAGGVMDAFVVAFRVPDLFRRLFGEGALTASYLPAVSRKLESDRDSAWQFASAMLAAVAVLVGGFVLLGELACLALCLALGGSGSVPLVVGLTATMLPYAMLVCLAAYISATLHALSHFSVPAFVTAVFNICWLAAAWLVAPDFGPDAANQAYVLAAAVVVGGCVQVAFQWPMLRRFGFRFRLAWDSNRHEVGAVLVAMMPTMFGLAVTQINTFVDSMMAWALTRDPNGPVTIAWLGDAEHPVRQGAAAAIYYSERLYYFPLGLVGLAVATVIFPTLSRHAARGDHQQLGIDLVNGMRLVSYLAIPAAVGLVMLGEPIARLLYQRGEFTANDTTRTAQMIACYAIGVPAFCALPVLLRGYYAMHDFATPVRVGIFVVGLNFVLNAVLVWPLAEQGLALATAAAAALHTAVLLWSFARRQSVFVARPLLMTMLRAAAASAAMAVAIWIALDRLSDSAGVGQQITRVGVTVVTAVGAYFLASHVVG
ncbi:MAG: murein biosynthesis integral membrane protein MurJ, partial [Pirellulales bacterium]|nr:murein biosynthesis integral membrane protein MurJ [Pirellulales bacterium]